MKNNEFNKYVRKEILKIWKICFGIERFFILDWWIIKLGGIPKKP